MYRTSTLKPLAVALSLSAFSGSIYAQSKEVGGITLGMPFDQAFAIAKKHIPNASKLETLDYDSGGKAGFFIQLLQNVVTRGPEFTGTDMFTARTTMSDHKVYSVFRQQEFAEKDKPLADAMEKALIEKYGPYSRKIPGYQGGAGYIWMYSKDGSLMKMSSPSYNRCVFNAESLIANSSSALSMGPHFVETKVPAPADCGYMVHASAATKGVKDVISIVTIYAADAPVYFADAEAFSNKEEQEAKNKLRQQQDAASRIKPKL